MDELLIIPNEKTSEYFCPSCRQLRLGFNPILKCGCCGNTSSLTIATPGTLNKKELLDKQGYTTMSIYSRPGTKIRFHDNITDAQVRWGGHDDPRGLLINGQIYTVAKTEVHTMHTKLYLKEHPGMSFNTIWFEEINKND